MDRRLRRFFIPTLCVAFLVPACSSMRRNEPASEERIAEPSRASARPARERRSAPRMVPPPIAARSNASAVAAPDAPFATGSAHFWGLVILLSAHLLAFSRYLGRFHGAGGAIARVVVAASLAYLFLGFVASASGYWFLANLAALLALAIFGRSRKDEEDEEEEERKEPSNVRPGLTTRAGIDRPEEREKDERHDPSRRA